MKKLISVIALCAVVTPAFSATKAARPSYLTRNSDGGYDVTYSYTDKVKSGWYGSVRAELAFLNWKNKYSSDVQEVNSGSNSDSYSFEPLFAPDVAFGKRFNYFWRAEVEAGYISKFTDKEGGYEFTLSAPYLIANGYYDFSNGLYVGAGLGAAFVQTELNDDEFVGSGKKTHVSPMAGLMAGFTHKLDDNLVLDLRYRIAGMFGTSQKRVWVDTALLDGYPVGGKYLENKIGLILDNSISIGIRYEF